MKFNFNTLYPVNESIKSRLLTCVLFGSFVSLFLFIFQPFGLSALPISIALISIAYGMICFAMMVILNVIVYLSLPDYFSEDNWTTKKELLWTILNVLLIGLANTIFSFLIKTAVFTWWNLFLFEAYTIALAVFPLTVSILLNQARLSNKFEQQSQPLNNSIENKKSSFDIETIPSVITIGSGTEEVTLLVDNFLYAKSDDNYVTVYYLDNTTVSQKTIRNTLKATYALFAEHKEIFKCHKSYIVNFKHVERISGNAQGFKLHLKGTDKILPVSRSLNGTIKSYFTNCH